jgi:hypothetical protein
MAIFNIAKLFYEVTSFIGSFSQELQEDFLLP